MKLVNISPIVRALFLCSALAYIRPVENDLHTDFNVFRREARPMDGFSHLRSTLFMTWRGSGILHTPPLRFLQARRATFRSAILKRGASNTSAKLH